MIFLILTLAVSLGWAQHLTCEDEKRLLKAENFQLETELIKVKAEVEVLTGFHFKHEDNNFWRLLGEIFTGVGLVLLWVMKRFEFLNKIINILIKIRGKNGKVKTGN
jgi:hypothetical protein